MISAEIFRKAGHVQGFTVKNHGDSIVCAAVSMLVLNTVNSIEVLTEDNFTCDYNENGGFITFSLNGKGTEAAGILLNAMVLGLKSAEEQYPEEITIREK